MSDYLCSCKKLFPLRRSSEKREESSYSYCYKHIDFKKGKLPDLCWEEYNKRDISTRVTGQTDLISIDNLSDSALISKLEEEITYLETIN